MFLITISCMHDDIPLRVFGDREAAVEFAKAHDGKVPESTLDMLSIDPPETLGVALWTFGGDGVLVSREILRWFEDETREGDAA